jgi:hypothetical protein
MWIRICSTPSIRTNTNWVLLSYLTVGYKIHLRCTRKSGIGSEQGIYVTFRVPSLWLERSLFVCHCRSASLVAKHTCCTSVLFVEVYHTRYKTSMLDFQRAVFKAWKRNPWPSTTNNYRYAMDSKWNDIRQRWNVFIVALVYPNVIEYCSYTAMFQFKMGICKAICPEDNWTGFVYVVTKCLQQFSVHLSEILIVECYISDYLLPRLCPSPDVLEIIKSIANSNKIPLFCERICPGIQA